MMRVGFGYDVHQFADDRELWIGGIRVPYDRGLAGHSDADVLIHAICDALLGAANLRDIGYHFSDKDPEYKGIDSKILLKECVRLIGEKGYKAINVDATVCAEEPKLNPYVPEMQRVLAECMNIDTDAVSIKATTTERLGFTGRKEGMSAYSVCLIESK